MKLGASNYGSSLSDVRGAAKPWADTYSNKYRELVATQLQIERLLESPDMDVARLKMLRAYAAHLTTALDMALVELANLQIRLYELKRRVVPES